MEKRKLRAAAYCRVSTGTDLQDGSFETQCSYYQRRIQENPALVCAGIYGNQGKSGRSIRSRPALQQLLKDCEEVRIDLILTKSVSRFARNLQECVEMTRRLSDLGVTVRFEREGLDTGSMDGELMLGILAAIAQEESASISSNIQ
jgi:DNA invertase Pin-like site-specific DNA recombinase